MGTKLSQLSRQSTFDKNSISALIGLLQDSVETFVERNPGSKNDADDLIDITKKIAHTIADRNFARQLELKSVREQAHAGSLAKSSFLANISHEIRTPLGAIIGFADLIEHHSMQKSEMTGYLSVIRRNSNQLLRIIDDLLDLSKVESGRMALEYLPFSLTDVLNDFSAMEGQRARDKGIEFEVSAGSLIPDLIISDAVRVRQILMNVVGNAIKFTAKGKVELKVSFDSGALMFDVVDTGIGISAQQAETLFQAFTQADISTTRKFGGTGLGLVLTKKLCEAMGGEFELIKSVVNQGSTFRAKIAVSLPSTSRMMTSDSIEFASTIPSFLPAEGERLAGMKILLVEDSPDNQALISIVLQKSGADVEIASDGIEGVEKARAKDFSAIIMDVQMPRMDGHEATKTLRSYGYRKPIVALTAHAMKEERERCTSSGFSNFLSKPLQREVMIDLLEDIFQSQKQGILVPIHDLSSFRQ